MNRLQPAPVPPWFRQPLVWLIIAIPLSSVIMGVVIITLSVLSDDGLVADDYYKRGLEINRVLDRDSAAVLAALEGQLQLGSGVTRFSLVSGDAETILPPTLTARFSYATRAGLDQQRVLSRRTGSDYEGPAVSLSRGRWYVEVGTAGWRLTGHLDVVADSVGDDSVVMRAIE